MKKYIFILLLLPLANISYSQGIDFFHGTWEEALEKAKTEDKLIFVDAFTKWCGPCKRMSKNIFTQRKAGDFYNSKFINVKIDMENADNASFIEKYPVKAYPTLFFIEGNGKIALKSVGGKKLEDLLKLGEKAILSNNKSEDYALVYEKGDRSFDFIIKYIKELNAANKSSLKIANDFLKSNPDISSDQMTILIYESMTEVDSKFKDLFVSEKSNIVKKFGAEGYEKKILSACHNTIDKAIEYESIELVEQAVEVCKSEHKKAYRKLRYNAYQKYYLAENNIPAYTKSVKKYYKAIAKKDSHELLNLIKEMSKSFSKDSKISKLTNKYLVQLIKIDASMDNLLFASNYYATIKDNANAIKYAELALVKAEEKGKSTKRIKQMIKYFKKA